MQLNIGQNKTWKLDQSNCAALCVDTSSYFHKKNPKDIDKEELFSFHDPLAFSLILKMALDG